ncbi:MAG TPA: hypothetical protein PL110_13075 [Candidatus Eremiobacteraeota bacterium]|nr:MAG: hypothetical protein BWY64_00625 [bacterium ADurb.Bin363]HPZ09044.1 hypothetical protein [Candidatus Eremiobacteraeota bacterium]
MKINTAIQTTQLKSQEKIKDKKTEGEPKESVEIGKQEEIPEFLKPAVASIGCAILGGGMAAVTSGTINGIIGMIDGAIGWGAQAIGGPIGGIVATVGMTGWSLVRNLRDPEPGESIFHDFKNHYFGKDSDTKKTLKAILAAGTTAAATALGANFGPTGILYGGLARGGTYALIKGTKWAITGASVGAAGSTVAPTTDVVQTATKELE